MRRLFQLESSESRSTKDRTKFILRCCGHAPMQASGLDRKLTKRPTSACTDPHSQATQCWTLVFSSRRTPSPQTLALYSLARNLSGTDARRLRQMASKAGHPDLSRWAAQPFKPVDCMLRLTAPGPFAHHMKTATVGKTLVSKSIEAQAACTARMIRSVGSTSARSTQARLPTYVLSNLQVSVQGHHSTARALCAQVI